VKFVSAGYHAHSNAHNAKTRLAQFLISLNNLNEVQLLLSRPIYMPYTKITAIRPLIKKLYPGNSQYMQIQSRLHTTCGKSIISNLYTLAEGIVISVRSLRRSKGEAKYSLSFKAIGM